MRYPLLVTSLLLCFGTVVHADSSSRESVVNSTPQLSGLEEKPRWEIGLGGAYVDGFDYPASGNPNRAGIVIPFVIYRGVRMRFAGRGFSAVALEKSNLKLDFSLAASLNADSEGNALRESMPDLDFLFEFGPQLILRLSDRSIGNGRLIVDWRNRVRAVLSTDFSSVDSQGWVGQTQMRVVFRRFFTNKLDVLAFANATWASEKLHDYYYQVDSQFETAVRPRYDARSGFLGTNFFVGSALRVHPNARFFGGIQIGYFAGSANKESPLFEDELTLGAALGFAWTAYRSKETISVLEED